MFCIILKLYLWSLNYWVQYRSFAVSFVPWEYVFQWLRLALSKGPNRVGVAFPSPEDGNRSSFRNVMFSSYLEFRTTDKVQKPADSESIFSFVHSYFWLSRRSGEVADCLTRGVLNRSHIASDEMRAPANRKRKMRDVGIKISSWWRSRCVSHVKQNNFVLRLTLFHVCALHVSSLQRYSILQYCGMWRHVTCVAVTCCFHSQGRRLRQLLGPSC
jgi:hypothetical protein